MKLLRWLMLVAVIAFLIVIFFTFQNLGATARLEPVIEALKQQYSHQGVPWKFVQIGMMPYELLQQCNLPPLDNNHIYDVEGAGGIVWFSDLQPGDSCYMIVKTKYGYNVEWFKRSSARWYAVRTCRVGNVLSALKTKDRDW